MIVIIDDNQFGLGKFSECSFKTINSVWIIQKNNFYLGKKLCMKLKGKKSCQKVTINYNSLD